MSNYIDNFESSQSAQPPSWFEFAPLPDEMPNDAVDSWGVPSSSYQDLDIGIPYSQQPYAPPDCDSTKSSSQEPHPPELNNILTPQALASLAPTTLPATIKEHLENLFKWPRLDPSVIVLPRPATTAAQLKTFRIKTRLVQLKEGQYAKDVMSFDEIKNAIIDGRCGTGKSTLAMKHRNFVIFIAPTTVIIDQQANPHCQVIKANVTPDFERYQQFASTYDSLPRLVAAAREAGLNPYLIPLIIDEFQHFLSDGFKLEPFDLSMSEVRKFKDVTLTSATVPPFFPYFEHLPKIVIKPASPFSVGWSYVIGEDVPFLEKMLADSTILYHLNNKKLIDVISEHVNKLGYVCSHVDADNKDEMMANGLADKRLPDADLFSFTSVFNDGISVHKHKHGYIVVISEQSARLLGPYEIYQFVRRLRDSNPVHVYIMRSTNEFDEDAIFSDETYKQQYISLTERAEMSVRLMNQMYQEHIKWMDESSSIFKDNAQELFDGLFSSAAKLHFRFNEELDAFEVNSLAIGQLVYKRLQRACYSSRYMMQHHLAKYGLHFCSIIEGDKESELGKDLMSVSKSLSNDDRETMRQYIANFNTLDDVVNASKQDVAMTYTQASEALPFSQFTKELGKEGQEDKELREEYRMALREKVKEAHLEKKAAETLREHVRAVYQANPKSKPETVLAIAKRELAGSTLTGKALKALKYAKELQATARGIHDTSLTKVLHGAFFTEVLKGIRVGIPLVDNEVNASFERGFELCEFARKEFTVIPRKKKGEELTEKDIASAAKKQWKKRKELLNYFFEMKSKRASADDGTRLVIWTPTKAISPHLESKFVRAIKASIVLNQPLCEKTVNETFEANFHLSARYRDALTVPPQAALEGEPTAKEVDEAALMQWKLRREFISCFFKMKSKQVMIDGQRHRIYTPVKALH